MKAVILIFALLTSNLSIVFNNTLPADCNVVSSEINNCLQTETDDCCSDFCNCNCCSHSSVITLITVKNNCENISTSIVNPTDQYLLEYQQIHWQPPKV